MFTTACVGSVGGSNFFSNWTAKHGVWNQSTGLMYVHLAVLLLWLSISSMGQPTNKQSSIERCPACEAVFSLKPSLQEIQESVNEIRFTGGGLGEQGPGPRFYPEDCRDVYNRGWRESGVYNIYQFLAGQPYVIQVYCDMDTDGGGWLVFQRRQDGSINFYRDWISYRRGFGDLAGEFWLGNDFIHFLTGSKPQELRVDLTDADGISAFANYGEFYVGPHSTFFQLNISSHSGSTGSGIGTGLHFTTFDEDHDTWGSNCAVRFRGGWWYSACHGGNLNGHYATPGNQTTYADTVTWRPFRGYYYSLKHTEMKMRPKE